MAEMILPGTYIEVRAEGLIAPGPISIGNVGIVGTARRGMLGNPDPDDPDAPPPKVYTPANIGEARDIFGQYDAYDNPDETVEPRKELTLVRALELAYASGAQRVFAVRVARTPSEPDDPQPGDAINAAYTLEADGGQLSVTAVAPGDGYDEAMLTTGPYALGLGVQVNDGGSTLESLGGLPPAPADFVAQVNAASQRFTASNSGGDADIAVGAATTRTTDGADPTPAVFSVAAGEGTVVFTARQPGTAMNSASIEVAQGSAADNCNVTLDDGAGTVEDFTDVPRAPADFANAFGGSALFTVADNGGDDNVGDQEVTDPATAGTDGVAAVFTIPAGTGSVSLTARTPGVAASNWNVSVNGYLDVSFTLDGTVETWRSVPSDPAGFAQVINGNHPTYNYRTLASTGEGSSLFRVDVADATGNVAQKQQPPRGQASPQTALGTNGANASPVDYGSGLAALENENVHIVVLAGQGLDMRDKLVDHTERASRDLMKRERIGIIGSDPSRQRTDLVAPAQDEGRLVFVGPGVKVFDAVANREVPLPGTYAAAAVAGRIASLDPHASPTNKTINVRSLESVFNGTDLEQLVLGRVLALESRNGAIKIVRGITTSTNTAWAQITTRRIVDYARFGVRAAADPFIGKLNNERVRQAMKGSINSLLADMVDREMLISYELDVSATRAQQIRGIAQVTMVLRPTFSIDYIRVVMYLE